MPTQWASKSKSKSEEDADRRKREAALLLLIALLARDLDRISARIANHTVSAADGAGYIYSTLYTAHQQAATLGIQQGGGVVLLGQRVPGLSIATKAFESQRAFLQGFITDMNEGRYGPKRTGGEGAIARKRRCALYGQRLIGTANQAWLSVIQAKGEMVLWQLGKVDKDRHCRDCILEASFGYRKPYLLTRVPGDGSTKCIVNCACCLVTESGNEAFRLMREN